VRMMVLGRGIDGRQLGRWVRPDQGDTSLVGKPSETVRQLVILRVLEAYCWKIQRVGDPLKSSCLRLKAQWGWTRMVALTAGSSISTE
jgi:hypothetical protein